MTHTLSDGAVQPDLPVETEASTACNAYVCSRNCREFVPGRKIGRDTQPSCATCTHSEQTHRPRPAGDRKVRR